MCSLCVELKAAYKNYETGRQYWLLRELGVNLTEDDHSGIEVITPEACKKHFLKRGGEPNAPAVTQKEVRTDLDREPSFV